MSLITAKRTKLLQIVQITTKVLKLTLRWGSSALRHLEALELQWRFDLSQDDLCVKVRES